MALWNADKGELYCTLTHPQRVLCATVAPWGGAVLTAGAAQLLVSRPFLPAFSACTFCWHFLPAFSGIFCWQLLAFCAGICWHFVLAFAGIFCRYLLAFAGICWHLAGICCWHFLLAFAGICSRRLPPYARGRSVRQAGSAQADGAPGRGRSRRAGEGGFLSAWESASGKQIFTVPKVGTLLTPRYEHLCVKA